MQTLIWKTLSPAQQADVLTRPALNDEADIGAVVKEIIGAVRGFCHPFGGEGRREPAGQIVASVCRFTSWVDGYAFFHVGLPLPIVDGECAPLCGWH